MTAPPPAPGGLLAVHAHPDDETLATGGLLAAWAAAGRPVTVVTCTRGERGEVIPEDLAALRGDGPALARHREFELAAALAHLGVTDHRYLDRLDGPDGPHGVGGPYGVGGLGRPARPGTVPGPATTARPGAPGAVRFEDSGMAWVGAGRAGAAERVPDGAFVAVPVEDAALRLAGVLRDRRPRVVVTYEPAGGYGHPDHVHAHRVTMRAVRLAAATGGVGGPAHTVPAVLWAAVPDDVLRAARHALSGLPAAAGVRAARPRLTLPDPAGALPTVAVPPGAVDLRVDVGPVLDRVVAALRAHATQVGSVALGPPMPLTSGVGLAGCYALSNDVLAPLLTVEWYRRAPGWPRGPVDRPLEPVADASGDLAPVA